MERDLFGPQGEVPPQETSSRKKDAPLADRMRPVTLDEVVGQDHLIGPGKVLRRAIERDEVRSVFEATPSEDPALRARVNRAMAEKYGLADRLWALLSDRRLSVPIRLDPGPADAQPLRRSSRHDAEQRS